MTGARPSVAVVMVLFASLISAGGLVPGSSTTRAANPAAGAPQQQEARPPAAAAQEPPRPAAAGLGAKQGPLVLQAEVVDSQGNPLPAVDIGVTIGYQRGSKPATIFERTRSDGKGQVRLEVARERPIGIVAYAYLWAHQPGRSVAAAAVNLGVRTSPPPVRLTLEAPAKWATTVLGPDDRPMAGLRIAPYAVRSAGRFRTSLTVPDEWVDRLTTTTDANGMATLTCLAPNMQLLAIRVAGPAIAPHALPINDAAVNGVVKLGRPGRLVGIVRTTDGKPLADVPVEVWVQGAGTGSSGLVNRSITPIALVKLGPASLKTGPQGAFQTPPALLNGSSYRVSIRHEGYRPFLSDWMTLDGERTAVPAIRLEPLRTLTGRITDSQGRAVAGARVFVAGQGSEAATDAGGRFTLLGVQPGKAVILAEKAGFRLRGRPVDPSASTETGSLTLARAGEAVEPAIRPVPEVLPLEESRALAEQLLRPNLPDEAKPRNDHLNLAAIAVLGSFDPDHALKLLQNGEFQKDAYYARVRAEIAAGLAEKDPARAVALVEAIPDSGGKVRRMIDVARALPVSERARKNALLDQAVNGLKALQPYVQLQSPLPAIVEQWLDLGERDRARLLLQKGKSLYDAVPAGSTGTLPEFLRQLARLEPDPAIERLRKIPDLTKSSTMVLLYDSPASVAVGLATDHPAEAEWAFNLWDRTGVQWQWYTNRCTMSLCYRLARVDPARACRVAMAQRGPAERALAWAYVALGLAEKDRAGAAEAIDHAIDEIDRLRQSGPGPEVSPILSDVLLMYPTNPAALILPVVERAAPNRLDDIFWRAVALHPRVEEYEEHDFQHSYIGFECILLSRYDRAVAAALFAPMDAYLHSLAARRERRNAFAYSHLVAKGCIDPRAALSLLEALTPTEPSDPPVESVSNPAYTARMTLARAFGQPAERRWKFLWSRMGMQLPLGE